MLTQSRVIARGSSLLLALVVTMPVTCLAQSATETVANEAIWPDNLTAWASVGLGTGNTGAVDGSSDIAGVLRATASVGPWLATYRTGDIGPFISAGSGVRDNGVLAGMRTGGHRIFASAAVGYARATPYHQSDNSSYPTIAPSVGALAYELTLHANAVVPGLALSMFGDIGPARSSYSAFTVSVELGWFGR